MAFGIPLQNIFVSPLVNQQFLQEIPMFGRIMSRALALAVVVFAVGSMAFAQDLDDVTVSGKLTVGAIHVMA